MFSFSFGVNILIFICYKSWDNGTIEIGAFKF